LILDVRYKLKAGRLLYCIKSEGIIPQMSFKDPNAPNSPESFTQHRSVRGKEYIPCYKKQKQVKKQFVFESVNHLPP